VHLQPRGDSPACLRELRCGVGLREALLTNDVDLSDEMLVAVRDRGMRLAISLDGIGVVHDGLRGAGTFARVARSLDRAIALGLQPHISVTVTARNAAGLRDVAEFLLERDLAFSFNFYRESACSLVPSPLQASAAVLTEGVRSALALIEDRLPRRSILTGLLDRTNLGAPHTRPCGVGQSYVAIGPAGQVARRHMYLEKAIGSVRDVDPIAAVRTADDRWHNVDVDAGQECRVCIWRYFCAGGCPLLADRMAGHASAPPPYCAVYRSLLPDLVRLEGLRLIRWGSPVA